MITTILGFGSFQSENLNNNLLELQLFIGLLMIAMIILKGVVMDLQNANNEKELLLKEIHHRVNNNLQVITGLLILQSRTIESEEVKNLFKQSQFRINTMAMIHEMLYKSDNLMKVNYEGYLTDLTKYLLQSMKGGNHQIHLDVSAPNIKLNVDTAIPLGLLINEIFTNSLKYGPKDQDEGEIYIHLRRKKKQKYLLKIGDSGDGFDAKSTKNGKKSLGLKLINGLVDQLNGTMEKDESRKGTHYKVVFEEIGINMPN